MKKAIYPGSFDPLHEGHLEIIEKASKLFDELFVVVSNNEKKKNSSSLQKRYELTKQKINISNVKVIKNDKMTTDIANELNAHWIVRSGRNNMDFEYEIELFKMYKKMSPKIESIIILPNAEFLEISSSKVREAK